MRDGFFGLISNVCCFYRWDEGGTMISRGHEVSNVASWERKLTTSNESRSMKRVDIEFLISVSFFLSY